MVLGPDGDPVPPAAFSVAAAEQPDAHLALPDGTRVPSPRVAAVLEAQARGRLIETKQGAESWIRAMLGVGAGPEVVGPDELNAEVAAQGADLTLFGRELLISTPSAGAFVIGPVRAEEASELLAILWQDRTRIGAQGLSTRLRREAAGPPLPDASPGGFGRRPELSSEMTLPGCILLLENEALTLSTPGGERFRFVPVARDATDPPPVRICRPDGEPVTSRQVVEALGLLVRADASPQQLGGEAAGDAPVDDVIVGPPAERPEHAPAGAGAEPPAEAIPRGVAAVASGLLDSILEPTTELDCAWQDDPSDFGHQDGMPPTIALDPVRQHGRPPDGTLEPVEPLEPLVDAQDEQETTSSASVPELPAERPDRIRHRPDAAAGVQPTGPADGILTAEDPTSDMEGAEVTIEASAQPPSEGDAEPPAETGAEAPNEAGAEVTIGAEPPAGAGAGPPAEASVEPPVEVGAGPPSEVNAESSTEQVAMAAEDAGRGVDARPAVTFAAPAAGSPHRDEVPQPCHGPPPVRTGWITDPEAEEERSTGDSRTVPLVLDPPLTSLADGSTPAVILIGGLPPNAKLSAGLDNRDGTWTLAALQLTGLDLELPAGTLRTVTLRATAVGIDRGGGMSAASCELRVASDETAEVRDGAHGLEDHEIGLDLYEIVRDIAGEEPPRAIVIGGLPRGTRFSSGTYDPQIACWVIRPEQLESLRLIGSLSGAARLSLRITTVVKDQATGDSGARSRTVEIDAVPDHARGRRETRVGGVGFWRPLAERRTKVRSADHA